MNDEELLAEARKLRKQSDERMGAGEAFVEGLKGGLPLSEDIEALGGYLGASSVEGVAPEFVDEVTKRIRPEVFAGRLQASEEHPKMSGAGNVLSSLGTLILPAGTAAKGAQAVRRAYGVVPKVVEAIRSLAPSAATAFLYGAGKSEDPSLSGRVESGATNALVDVTAGQALRGALSKLPHMASDMARDADVLRIATIEGATGGPIGTKEILKRAESIPGGVKGLAARVRATPEMGGWFRSAQDIGAAAGKLKEQAGEVIGDIGNVVDEAGMYRASDLPANLRARADQLRYGPGRTATSRETADALDELAAQQEELFPGRGMTFGQLGAQKKDWQSQAPYVQAAQGRTIPGQKEALIEAAKLAREQQIAGVGQAIGTGEWAMPPSAYANVDMVYPRGLYPGGTPLDAKEAYKGALAAYQHGSIIEDQAKKSATKAAGNLPIGLLDVEAGKLGTDLASEAGVPKWLGALFTGSLAKAMKSGGKATQASIAESVRSVLGDQGANPTALKALDTLSDALRRGPQATAVWLSTRPPGDPVAAALARVAGDEPKRR